MYVTLLILVITNIALASFGGFYETTDPGASSSCEDANILTGACLCPSGSTSNRAARVINDADGGRHGGYIFSCGSNTPVGFSGTYQLDDPAPGGMGCRYPNIFTGGCSCPASTKAITTRIIVDTLQKTLIGSHLTVCYQDNNGFGGIYQVDDTNACRTLNPLTGGCSCPSSYDDQPLRVLIDSGENIIGSYIHACVANSPMIEICPGVDADPTGKTGANDAIQTCIDRTPVNGVLELPVGFFRMSGQIVINKSITITTKGTSGKPSCVSGTECARLMGSPELYAFGGILRIFSTNWVVIDHIIVDGNRAARVNSKSWNECSNGSTRYGYNIQVASCTGCSFTNSISTNAVCGSSCEWTGEGAHIINSGFISNGDHFTSMMWSDGLTLLNSPSIINKNGSIERQTQLIGNLFMDNSDVDMVSGGADYAIISDNIVNHSQQPSFAGLMFDNFDNSQPGSFIGATMINNKVQCIGCTYGINLGPHGWYMSNPIIGGNVTNNYITGSYFNLNVDGAGTNEYPISVFDNTFGQPVQGSKCGVPGTNYVVCSNTISRHLSPPDRTNCLDGCH